jgi:pyruvate kinase
MLNNEFMLMQADRFARRVIKEAGNDPVAQVKTMYEIALSREPSAKEVDTNVAFLKKQQDHEKASGSASEDVAALAALTDLAHVTLNLNEFVYIR